MAARMSALSPELLVATPALVGALLYAIKRLSSFDLEIRAQRERQRAHYLAQFHLRASLERLAGTDDALGSAHHGRLASVGGAPDDAIAACLSIDDLRGMFGGLSQQHHDILVMREFEGLSYREIGERLGMSRAGVESTLFRARRRLSKEYEELANVERLGVSRAGVQSTLFRARRRLSEKFLPKDEVMLRHRARTDIPPWALALLDCEVAERCAREWAAHLHERVEHGELREARADRRAFVRYALILTITSRVRRVLSRSRS
jgi:RNA polymerase sigma factor (sigma-70 family)